MQPLSSPDVLTRAPIVCCNQFQGFGDFFFPPTQQKTKSTCRLLFFGWHCKLEKLHGWGCLPESWVTHLACPPPRPSSPHYPQGISALILWPSSLRLPPHPTKLMPHLELSIPEGTYLTELSRPLSAKVLPISSDNFAFNYSLRGTQLNLSN